MGDISKILSFIFLNLETLNMYDKNTVCVPLAINFPYQDPSKCLFLKANIFLTFYTSLALTTLFPHVISTFSLLVSQFTNTYAKVLAVRLLRFLRLRLRWKIKVKDMCKFTFWKIWNYLKTFKFWMSLTIGKVFALYWYR